MQMDINSMTIGELKEIKKMFEGVNASDVSTNFIFDPKEYVIVRTQSAGVFAGYITRRIGQEVTMRDARRIWRWSGAASLSQLANEGSKNPSDCKFPAEVDKITLLQVVEILSVTKAGEKSIKAVPVWKM